MITPRRNAYSPAPRKRFRWWRGLLGALLTFSIIVPYIMGGDVEKYLRRWLGALNQGNPQIQLKLVDYHRHWFTSNGDIQISGKPLHETLTLHLKAYHGPLFLNAGHRIRFGLALLKGTIDTKKFLGQKDTIKLAGPIQLTAFVPYFKDRELHTQFPAATIYDKKNKLTYRFNALKGTIDDDGLLQMQIPTLNVSHADGSKAININTGILRILSRNYQASFTAKKIDFYRKNRGSLTITNLFAQAEAAHRNSTTEPARLELNIHFDQFQRFSLTQSDTQPSALGPFKFNLKIKNLHTESLVTTLNLLKTISLQQSDLSLEQGERLEKALSNIFSSDTTYTLTSKLSTSNGQFKTQFQGGFNPLKGHSDLLDAFYSRGSIKLSADLKSALAEYAASKARDSKNLPTHEGTAIATLLGFLKPQGDDYIAKVDIQEGQIILNGKNVKS